MENTIRWKEVVDKEGNINKEANARFVRWSDGSLSLHLGSEIFDVYKQPLQVFWYMYNIDFCFNFLLIRVTIIIYLFDKALVYKVKQYFVQN